MATPSPDLGHENQAETNSVARQQRLKMGTIIIVDTSLKPAHRAFIAILVLAMPLCALWSAWQNFGATELRGYYWMILYAEIAMVAALVGLDVSHRGNRSRSFKSSNMALAIAFALSAGISTLLAFYKPGLAWFHYGATLLHVGFGWLLLLEMRRSPNFANCLLPGIAVGIAIFSVIVFFYVLALGDVSVEVSKFVGVGVSNVRHVGYYVVALFGIAAGLFLVSNRESKQRRFWAAIICLSIFMSLWLGGRGAFLSMLGTLILLTVLAERAEAKKLLILCGGAFLVSIPLAAITAPDSPFYGPSVLFGRLWQGSADVADLSPGRIELWTQAIRMIGEHPWFGLGENQFRFALIGPDLYFNQPHNILLQLLVQWGVIGTALLFIWIGNVVVALRVEELRKRPQFLAATGALSCLLLQALIDGPFFMFYPLIAAITAFLYLICAQDEDRSVQR